MESGGDDRSNLVGRYNWFTKQPDWYAHFETALQSLTYDNEAVALREESSAKLFGEHIEASVSRMELFEQCAFRHFSQYGLNLKERDIYRLEAFDIGELFHAVLKDISDVLKRENKTWKTMTEEECRHITGEVTKAVIPKIQRHILESSNHFRYVQYKLTNIMQSVTKTLREQAIQSNFETIDLEVEFGRKSPLQSPVYTLDNGATMSLRGRIDRVDQATTDRGSYMQVVDYKSSEQSLSFTDVLHGISLQMPVYLDIVVNGAKSWMGIEAHTGGMFYFHVHNPVIDLTEADEDTVIAAERFKSYKMNGWLQKDPAVASLMDEEFTDTGASRMVPAKLKKRREF